MPAKDRLALLSCLCCLFVAGNASAAERTEPYRLKLVLHVAKHPLLTDVFRDQVARELRDGLQAALGELARVEVTSRHDRLPDVLRRGLDRGLTGWAERSPYKTHFVLVDYFGVHYGVQARQYDGQLGMLSPVVRRERTRDRAFVARTAALLVAQDLGLWGTVTTDPDAGNVEVELKGGGLKAPLARWVKEGDVFALPRIPYTVLQVVKPPSGGVCTCRVYSHYKLRSIRGQTCVKLGAVEAPLRLRLLQKTSSGLAPLEAALTVQVRRAGFEGEDATRLQQTADALRDVDTAREGEKGKFNKLAFVAIAKVREALKRSREDYEQVSAQRAELKKGEKKLTDRERRELAVVDERLRQLKAGETELDAHVRELEKIEKEESDPVKREWRAQVQRGKLLEKEAEVGQAIAIYKKVLKEGYKSPDLVRHLADLEKAWQTRSADHEKARRFIYSTWPALRSSGEMQPQLANARDAFDVCRRAADTIAPRKMLLTTRKHAATLVAEAKTLNPKVNKEDIPAAKVLAEVSAALKKLDDDISAYLEKVK
jgi:hypothetical protein